MIRINDSVNASKAAQCMGLPGPGTENLEDLEKRFSDDILKIELSGPDHHYLSVVDVPGLFHSKRDAGLSQSITDYSRSYQVSDGGRQGHYLEID